MEYSGHAPDKLRYDALTTVGRELERNQLETCFRRLLLSNMATSSSASASRGSSRRSGDTHGYKKRPNYKELVWIKGYSGAGVSTLAKVREWRSCMLYVYPILSIATKELLS